MQPSNNGELTSGVLCVSLTFPFTEKEFNKNRPLISIPKSKLLVLSCFDHILE